MEEFGFVTRVEFPIGWNSVEPSHPTSPPDISSSTLLRAGLDERLEVICGTNKALLLLVCVLQVRVHFLLIFQLICWSTIGLIAGN